MYAVFVQEVGGSVSIAEKCTEFGKKKKQKTETEKKRERERERKKRGKHHTTPTAGLSTHKLGLFCLMIGLSCVIIGEF